MTAYSNDRLIVGKPHSQPLEKFIEFWIDRGQTTQPTDRDRARECVDILYKHGKTVDGKPPPTPPLILFVRSPAEGNHLVKKLMPVITSKKVAKRYAKQLLAPDCPPDTKEMFAPINRAWEHLDEPLGKECGAWCCGQHHAAWLCFYETAGAIFGKDIAKLQGQIELGKCAGWWISFEECIIISDPPCEIHFDADNKLHKDDGPAIMWRDGWPMFFWHGIPVFNENVIMRPDDITTDNILNESNQELRRIMLTQYKRGDREARVKSGVTDIGEETGCGMFVKNIGANPIDESDYGTLYRIPMGKAEDIVVVEVVNSTMGSDGTFKHYLIQVPPKVNNRGIADRNGSPVVTAKQAVAATFGVHEDNYQPSIQT